MKKTILIALSFLCVAGYASAQTATDVQNIQKAKAAVDGPHRCEEALSYLRLITDSGRSTTDFLLTNAKAYDCKSNKEQAIFYYGKYLEQVPGNDSVKKRVAELKNDQAKAQNAKTNKQEVLVNRTYKQSRDGGPCIDDNDFAWGFSCDMYTGGKSSPFKEAVNFFNVRQVPFAKNHLIFEFTTDLGIALGGRKDWFAHAFNTTTSDVTKVPGSVKIGIDADLCVVIINKHKFGLSAGPLIGISAGLMPDVYMDATSNDYSNPILFAPVTGVRTGFFVSRHFYFTASYLVFLKSSFSNDVQQGTTRTNLNCNSLTIGAGFRILGTTQKHHHHRGRD